MPGNCQIPTPEAYVDQMLDYIGYSEDLYGKKVLENSCGEGNILLKIVMRYIESAKRQQRTNSEIKEGLQRDIVAYEIDNRCIEACKKRLDEFVNSCGIKNVNWNLNHKDFLNEKVTATYDYVVGNPPYITYHDMDNEQRNLLKDNQEFLKGILEILEKDRQYVLRKLAELYEKEHPAKKIQEEINRKAEKQEEKDRKARIHGSVVVSGEQETEQPEETVSALAAKQVLDAKDEQIVELENEIKMLRALATTGIVTNTYIHEFKTLSHHLSLKIVMAKEAIEEDKDMETACVYINQANEIREGFNSWFQVTIESLKKDKRRRRKTDITQIISEAAESWNKTLHSKHIEIIFQGDPQQKLYMRCFPYEIDTILTNLISNSTASFEKIKTSEKKIYVDVKTENEYIRIDYSDTGAGLDAIYKNNPEKTLEVFETDKRNASGEKIGTGMGLWIVNNTVQEYGGKIDLSRNITEKTGYYITIFFKKWEMINNV